MRCVTVSSFYAIIISLLIFKSNYLLHFWVTPKTQLQPHNKHHHHQHHHFCLSECACFKAKFIFFTLFFFLFLFSLHEYLESTCGQFNFAAKVGGFWNFTSYNFKKTHHFYMHTGAKWGRKGQNCAEEKARLLFFFLEVMGLGWCSKRRITKWNDVSYGRREGKEP